MIDYNDMMEGLAQAWANNWAAAYPPPKTMTDAEISSVIDSNLKDCTLIGPAAGAELRALVYG